jgi:uncharacterized membrane protein
VLIWSFAASVVETLTDSEALRTWNHNVFIVILSLPLTSSRASYRDLLGTAERIIEMDEKMQQVEYTLGQVGQHCNSRVVEKMFVNYGKMDEHLQIHSACKRTTHNFPTYNH